MYVKYHEKIAHTKIEHNSYQHNTNNFDYKIPGW